MISPPPSYKTLYQSGFVKRLEILRSRRRFRTRARFRSAPRTDAAAPAADFAGVLPYTHVAKRNVPSSRIGRVLCGRDVHYNMYAWPRMVLYLLGVPPRFTQRDTSRVIEFRFFFFFLSTRITRLIPLILFLFGK